MNIKQWKQFSDREKLKYFSVKLLDWRLRNGR